MTTVSVLSSLYSAVPQVSPAAALPARRPALGGRQRSFSEVVSGGPAGSGSVSDPARAGVKAAKAAGAATAAAGGTASLKTEEEAPAPATAGPLQKTPPAAAHRTETEPSEGAASLSQQTSVGPTARTGASSVDRRPALSHGSRGRTNDGVSVSRQQPDGPPHDGSRKW